MLLTQRAIMRYLPAAEKLILRVHQPVKPANRYLVALLAITSLSACGGGGGSGPSGTDVPDYLYQAPP